MKKVKYYHYLIILLIISLFIIPFLIPKKLIIDYEQKARISINEIAYNTDFIHKLKNGHLKTSKQMIDTSTLGSQIINFIVVDNYQKEHTYSYELDVYDEEKPTISFNKELIIEKGSLINLLNNVIVTDNSKENIIPVVKGKYDMNQKGTYNLTYEAQDSSGNVAREDFTLTVTASKESSDLTTNSSLTTNPDSPTTTNFTTSKGFSGTTINGVTYIDGYLIVNKTYFLPANYGTGLTSQTKEAFDLMSAAAKLDGLNIWLQSGYRSYERQKTLYENYVIRDGLTKADTYSARPGHSEHQSGLAFDVNQINDSFINSPEAIWLAKNCYKYGFILRYPAGKTAQTGYKYEPWHFRYVGVELATKLYNNGDWLTLEEYFGITSNYQTP